MSNYFDFLCIYWAHHNIFPKICYPKKNNSSQVKLLKFSYYFHCNNHILSKSNSLFFVVRLAFVDKPAWYDIHGQTDGTYLRQTHLPRFPGQHASWRQLQHQTPVCGGGASPDRQQFIPKVGIWIDVLVLIDNSLYQK